MAFTPAKPGQIAPTSAAVAAGAVDASPVDLPTAAPSVELLRYYKQRIEEFEAERELFLSRFQDIQVSHEELHRVKWELKVREEEVRRRVARASSLCLADLPRPCSDPRAAESAERCQCVSL